MSDPNPYQPPQTPEPLRQVQVLKRGLGMFAVVLLTPLAVLITGTISCLASTDFSTGELIPNTTELAVFVVPPLIVLVAMILWAVFAWRRDRRPKDDCK